MRRRAVVLGLALFCLAACPASCVGGRQSYGPYRSPSELRRSEEVDLKLRRLEEQRRERERLAEIERARQAEEEARRRAETLAWQREQEREREEAQRRAHVLADVGGAHPSPDDAFTR